MQKIDRSRLRERFIGHYILNESQSPETASTVFDNFETVRDAARAMAFIMILPEGLPLQEKIKLAKLNIPSPININQKIMGHEIKASTGGVHVDAPFQHEIIAPNGKRIATFNFYLWPRDGKTVVILNAIQGVRGRERELAEFSQAIKENWRVFVVKLIRNIATKKEFTVVGLLPPLFDFFGLSQEAKCNAEYRRQLRQYIQTFLKGGILPSNIDAREVSKKLHREWAERNLARKKGELLPKHNKLFRDRIKPR